MAYDNTNRGAIWKNDDKREDNHPDFKGSINVEGREYWVSAWKRKEGAAAKAPALSFTVKLKDIVTREPPQESISQRSQATVRRPYPRITSGLNDDMDDAIPF